MKSPYVLKEYKEIFDRPLEILFKISLEEVIVPRECKRANVAPISKSHPLNHPSHISPLCFC